MPIFRDSGDDPRVLQDISPESGVRCDSAGATSRQTGRPWDPASVQVQSRRFAPGIGTMSPFWQPRRKMNENGFDVKSPTRHTGRTRAISTVFSPVVLVPPTPAWNCSSIQRQRATFTSDLNSRPESVNGGKILRQLPSGLKIIQNYVISMPRYPDSPLRESPRL